MRVVFCATKYALFGEICAIVHPRTGRLGRCFDNTAAGHLRRCGCWARVFQVRLVKTILLVSCDSAVCFDPSIRANQWRSGKQACLFHILMPNYWVDKCNFPNATFQMQHSKCNINHICTHTVRRLFPLTDSLSEPWSLMAQAFYNQLTDKPLVWSDAQGGRWLAPNQVIM